MANKIRKVNDVETLTIRMTPEKYRELKVAAATTGLTAASYGRQAIYEVLARKSAPHQMAA